MSPWCQDSRRQLPGFPLQRPGQVPGPFPCSNLFMAGPVPPSLSCFPWNVASVYVTARQPRKCAAYEIQQPPGCRPARQGILCPGAALHQGAHAPYTPQFLGSADLGSKDCHHVDFWTGEVRLGCQVERLEMNTPCVVSEIHFQMLLRH